MTVTADQRVTAGVIAALRKGPLDVLGLLRVLRPVLANELAGPRGQPARAPAPAGPSAAGSRWKAAAGSAWPATAWPTRRRLTTRARFPGQVAVRSAQPANRSRERVCASVASSGTPRTARASRPTWRPTSATSARRPARPSGRSGRSGTTSGGSIGGARTVIFAPGAVEGLKRLVLHEGPWLLGGGGRVLRRAGLPRRGLRDPLGQHDPDPPARRSRDRRQAGRLRHARTLADHDLREERRHVRQARRRPRRRRVRPGRR